jgi:hypothetical protein
LASIREHLDLLPWKLKVEFKRSSFLQVPFLNLMANIRQRAGSVHIRIGGNTQETATLVASIPDGKAIEKDKVAASNPTRTPGLIFTAEIIYMLANISALANVKWYLGVPFNDTANLRLQIAEVGQAILGDNLIGLQVGNEPDLYSAYVLSWFSFVCAYFDSLPYPAVMGIDRRHIVHSTILASLVQWCRP